VTRHADGDARGVKLYMWGQQTWNRGTIEGLRHSERTQTLGWCGEPGPRIGGGSRSMVEVGGFDGGQPFATLPAFKNALQVGQVLVVRGVLVLVLFATLWLAWRSGLFSSPSRRWRPLLAGAAIVVLLLPPLGARFARGGVPIARHDLFDRMLPRRANEVVFEVEVDPQRLRVLEQWAAWQVGGRAGATDIDDSGSSFNASRGIATDLLTGFGWSDRVGDGVEVEVFAGDTQVAAFSTEGSGRRRRPIDLASLVAGLRSDPHLRVVARREGGLLTCASWQRGDLEGRRLRIDGELVRGPEVPSPILEVRLVPIGREYDPIVLLF